MPHVPCLRRNGQANGGTVSLTATSLLATQEVSCPSRDGQ